MPRGYYGDDGYAQLGQGLGELLTALLFGKDLEAKKRAREDLAPILERERISGETKPGIEFMNAQKPGMRKKIASQYKKATGEDIPRPEIDIPGIPMPGAGMGFAPMKIPGVEPKWPTSPTDYNMRAMAELAKGTPVSSMPPMAQETVQNMQFGQTARPFELFSRIENIPTIPVEAKRQLAKDLGIEYNPLPQDLYPSIQAATQGFHYYDISVDEFKEWAKTGIPPARELKERFPDVQRQSNPNLGMAIAHYEDLYSYALETGKISPEDYQKGLQELISSKGAKWPTDFLPVRRPTTSPWATQARQIANDLNISQPDVELILSQGTEEQKGQLFSQWENTKEIEKTRKEAKYFAITAIKLKNRKEAEMWLDSLIRSYNIPEPDRRGWIKKVLDSLWSAVAGKKPEEQLTPEQMMSLLDKELVPFRTQRPTSPENLPQPTVPVQGQPPNPGYTPPKFSLGAGTPNPYAPAPNAPAGPTPRTITPGGPQPAEKPKGGMWNDFYLTPETKKKK